MEAAPAHADAGLDGLLDYVRQVRGFDFTAYKRPSLTRRIQKRMVAAHADGYPAYQALLEAEPDEFARLFDTILINVTGFLRDRDAWDHLGAVVIPRMLDDRPHDAPIRVWSAGCASGQEVYSLAMLLCDALGEGHFRERVKLYGTDADDGALTQARQGRYSRKVASESLGEILVEQYFETVDDDIVFRKDLRRSMIFGRHDLLRDPPISRVDLLVCRNTLMYFNADAQRRILDHFHFALNEGGFLFLGTSEALVTRTNLFASEGSKHHVFQKRPSLGAERPPGPRPSLPVLAPRLMASDLAADAFECSPVAQLVVNRDGEVEMANRHARALFAIGSGDVGRPFKDLDVSFRPFELRSRIEQVLADRRPLTIGDVVYELPGGAAEVLEIRILPIGVDQAGGVSLTFAQVGRHKVLREELERAQRELETAYEELQSTVEELETTNEELQSTNEELETTNEELQSANEELETMNEELQSTNEELETINDELRQRSLELNEVNSYLETILSSIGVAVIVVDRDQTVQVWNSESTELWGVRADEASGQHLFGLDIGLPMDGLRTSLRRVLAGDQERADLAIEAVNRRGRRLSINVTCVPLTLGPDQVTGAILLTAADGASADGARAAGRRADGAGADGDR
ncbi:MAG: two-component system, chemotaxis family, CheB/CheR fusion protein, partial [Actinomycetota bacterium]|nr:two-component system, chemotaxis family, CheB/CheR fusion protein [Actinomycetota bacterium]